jgi:hypothetical protein
MEIEKLFFDLFVGRTDCYSKQLEKGYLAVKNPITLEIIKQHLLGTITIGVYQLLENVVKWGCLDFDLNTLEDFENAKKLFNHLVKLGLNPLMEMSGGGNYKCHIWVFSDTTAVKMQEFLKGVCDKLNIYPHEIFPKQTYVKEGDYGNLVKLPLGIHRKTNKRSYFLDSNFSKIESQKDVIKKLREYL